MGLNSADLRKQAPGHFLDTCRIGLFGSCLWINRSEEGLLRVTKARQVVEREWVRCRSGNGEEGELGPARLQRDDAGVLRGGRPQSVGKERRQALDRGGGRQRFQ